MRDRRMTLGVVVGILLLAASLVPAAFAQQRPTPQRGQEAVQRAAYQEKLQQVVNDKAGFAANIVQQWEGSARELGRWDENFASDFFAALMKLQPDNLITMSEATSLPEVMRVLATGRRAQSMQPDGQASGDPFALSAGQPILPDALGSPTVDLVFTPVTPCRIVDTRVAGGMIAATTTRFFDVDGTNFSAQGGVAAPCGIPFGVAAAVTMTITVTQPFTFGWFTAWGLGTKPLAAVLTYDPNNTLANTSVVPVVPGAGADFSLYSFATAHAIIDVVGYYAAPVATAFDCTSVVSATVLVPVNAWTNIDAFCPAGRSATGGGFDFVEGTLGVPGIWATSVPLDTGWRTWVDNQAAGARQVQTWVRCCRVPGR